MLYQAASESLLAIRLVHRQVVQVATSSIVASQDRCHNILFVPDYQAKSRVVLQQYFDLGAGVELAESFTTAPQFPHLLIIRGVHGAQFDGHPVLLLATRHSGVDQSR
jgi:hypothetical protein